MGVWVVTPGSNQKKMLLEKLNKGAIIEYLSYF